jgi:hypothetical protein
VLAAAIISQSPIVLDGQWSDAIYFHLPSAKDKSKAI